LTAKSGAIAHLPLPTSFFPRTNQNARKFHIFNNAKESPENPGSSQHACAIANTFLPWQICLNQSQYANANTKFNAKAKTKTNANANANANARILRPKPECTCQNQSAHTKANKKLTAH
jgi:hypothetical protein